VISPRRLARVDLPDAPRPRITTRFIFCSVRYRWSNCLQCPVLCNRAHPNHAIELALIKTSCFGRCMTHLYEKLTLGQLSLISFVDECVGEWGATDEENLPQG
jgi:hypothetical protein